MWREGVRTNYLSIYLKLKMWYILMSKCRPVAQQSTAVCQFGFNVSLQPDISLLRRSGAGLWLRPPGWLSTHSQNKQALLLLQNNGMDRLDWCVNTADPAALPVRWKHVSNVQKNMFLLFSQEVRTTLRIKPLIILAIKMCVMYLSVLKCTWVFNCWKYVKYLYKLQSFRTKLPVFVSMLSCSERIKTKKDNFVR